MSVTPRLRHPIKGVLMNIDRQRIAAVAALEVVGFSYTPDRGRLPPVGATTVADAGLTAEADAMHSLLVLRADELMGTLEESQEAPSLEMIADPSKPTKPSAGPTARSPAAKADWPGAE